MLLLALPPLGFSTPPTPCRLPSGSLIAGYATSCDSDGAPHLVEQAVAGVNVVIWFATSLQKNATSGRPQVTHHLNHTCVAVVAQELRRRGLITAHMISIGGWDAPHPDTSFSGEEWFEAWDEWNRGEVAQPALGFFGYDGIDWDLEGNDTPSSPWNRFTPACIELVGTMSQAAKRAGYLVSLVPPQSYADVGVAGFDLSLRHSYPEWQPDFQYLGTPPGVKDSHFFLRRARLHRRRQVESTSCARRAAGTPRSCKPFAKACMTPPSTGRPAASLRPRSAA